MSNRKERLRDRKGRLQDRKERLAGERMERERSRTRMARAFAAAAVILVAGVAIYYVASHEGEGTGVYQPAAVAGSSDASGAVTVPVSEVGASARFYTYSSGGTQVRFFAVKGPDGSVHVAADACDVCYADHKGYHQSASAMQCNSCGKVFQISSIGSKNAAGGCWPSYLPMRSEGGNVLVGWSDLDGKAYLFD